jgi:hypothetical protein
MLSRLRLLAKHRRTWIHSPFVQFSAATGKGIKLPYYQDGLLIVDFTETNRLVKLRVISAWRDDCELLESSSLLGATLPELSIFNDEISKLTSFKLNNNDDDATTDIDMTLSIPEYCNIQVKGNKMQFIQEKKIQGDVEVDIQKGDMIVNKVRGQSIRLHAWDGDINVKTSIEGKVELTGKAINIKMMNVDSLTLHAHHLNIEAMYSKTAEIVTFSHVEINHMQGQCNVRILLHILRVLIYLLLFLSNNIAFICFYSFHYYVILFICL